MNNQSDTPRTDALETRYKGEPLLTHTRTLERDLNATRSAWAADIRQANEHMISLRHEVETLKNDLDAEREAGLAQVVTITECSIQINELKNDLHAKRRLHVAECERLREQIAEMRTKSAEIIKDMMLRCDEKTDRIRELEDKPPPAPTYLDRPQWLPIDAAPKDGTRIVTAEAGHKGFWFQEDWWTDDETEWQYATDPIGWMPLPATPPPFPSETCEEDNP